MAKKVTTQSVRQSPQRRRAPAAGAGAAGAANQRQQPAAQNQTLADSVGEVLDEMLGPVIQQQQDLSDRLDELALPRSPFGATTQQLLSPRRSAAIHRGESANTSRGFSYLRAIALTAGFLPAEQCKVELSANEDLKSLFQGLDRGAPNGMLVPYGSRHLSLVDENFAEEMRQSCFQSVAGCDPDEMRSIRQNASIGDDTAGGSLVDFPSQGELIELVRAREAFPQAGATEVSLGPSGRVRFPRQTGPATGYWIGESTSITDSQQSTGDLNLIAKKLAALVKASNELFRFATPSYEQFVRNDLAKTLALTMDAACFNGGGGLSIKGLLNYNITDKTGVSGFATAATHGDTLLPTGPSLLLGELEDADHTLEKAAFMIRPKLWRALLNRRAGAAGDDAYGPFLFNVNRNEISKNLPAALEGAAVVRTTQVPKDRVKGNGTTLTTLICGAFDQFLIARSGVLELAASTQGDTAFTKDETWVRAIQHVDAGPRHESAFIMVDNLLETVV